MGIDAGLPGGAAALVAVRANGGHGTLGQGLCVSRLGLVRRRLHAFGAPGVLGGLGTQGRLGPVGIHSKPGLSELLPDVGLLFNLLGCGHAALRPPVNPSPDS